MGVEISCSSGVGNDGWTSWGGLVCPRLFRLFPVVQERYRMLQGEMKRLFEAPRP